MKVTALLLGFLLLQQPGSLVSIEGTVVRSGTSEAISKAIVQLSRADAEEPQVLVTSADGRFTYRDLAPGRYSLRVSRNGYIDGQPREVEVGSASSRNVRLSLTATGAISGRVYDNSGEPVANVSVEALKYSWADGLSTLISVKVAETNDRGEFRLFWLPPGRYYLSAVPNVAGLGGVSVHMAGGDNSSFLRRFDGDIIRNNGTSSTRTSGSELAPVFYPGTADPQAASSVDVTPGADIPGIDFVLVRAVTRKVKGIAIDGATGSPIRGVSLVLVPRNGSSIGQVALPPAFEGEGFEARNVLPGSYFLVGGARTTRFGDRDVRILGGRTAVDVGDRDVDGVQVVLTPAIDIAGRVLYDSGTLPQPTAFGLRHPVVSLRNSVTGIPLRSELYAQFADDYQFTIGDALEGDYRVQVTDLPPETYVKSIRFGPANARSATIQVDSRTRETLEIVLGSNAGTLDGVVFAGNGGSRDVLPAATIALIPAGAERERPDLFRGVSADSRGRFHFDGIPPGNYLLFAWEQMDEGLWREPEFVRRNERLARPLRISEGSHETVELNAIP